MKVIRIILQIIGAFVLGAFLLIVVWSFLNSPFSSKKVSNKNDAVFILNWAGINKNQDWKIIESSISARNMTGDHVDYYCIQLEHFDVNKRQLHEEWKQGPEKNDLLAAAVENAVEWAILDGSKYFPSSNIANSSSMKIMFWSVTTHGRRPTAAKVILYQPETKRLFYVSYDT